MAIIQFTEADALQTTIVEAATYPTRVTKIEGPSKSSSGKSINYFFDMTIDDGKYKGKTRTIVFNSESNSPSLLGDMQFFPQSHMLLLQAAIENWPTPRPNMLDTDKLLDRPFDAAWGVNTVDGHLTNTVNVFYPKGTGAQAPAF